MIPRHAIMSSSERSASARSRKSKFELDARIRPKKRGSRSNASVSKKQSARNPPSIARAMTDSSMRRWELAPERSWCAGGARCVCRPCALASHSRASGRDVIQETADGALVVEESAGEALRKRVRGSAAARVSFGSRCCWLCVRIVHHLADQRRATRGGERVRRGMDRHVFLVIDSSAYVESSATQRAARSQIHHNQRTAPAPSPSSCPVLVSSVPVQHFLFFVATCYRPTGTLSSIAIRQCYGYCRHEAVGPARRHAPARRALCARLLCAEPDLCLRT